jgi:hypothetical protein
MNNNLTPRPDASPEPRFRAATVRERLKATNASDPFCRRNLTMLNVLQQNIGGFCPLPVCAPED